jgi:hypothetical protein
LRRSAAAFVHASGGIMASMNAIILIVSVVVPLLPVVMFPTKLIGRGGLRTFIGAALLVGVMMLLYFGLQSFITDPGLDQSDAAAASGLSDADMSALQKLL